MTRAMSNLIKISIITFFIWVIFLILGLTINKRDLISNVLFGLGSFLLIPIIIRFFSNKTLNSENSVSKTEIANYLQKEEYQNLQKEKILLYKRINHLKNIYWFNFSLWFAILFIGLALIFALL